MITTWHGQRRVLKQPMDPYTYMKRGTETGVFRTGDEIDAMLTQRKLQRDPVKQVMRRFRQDIVRGAVIHDYPDEYRIVRQHPPPPFAGIISKVQLRRWNHEERLQQLAWKKQLEDMERYGTDGPFAPDCYPPHASYAATQQRGTPQQRVNDLTQQYIQRYHEQQQDDPNQNHNPTVTVRPHSDNPHLYNTGAPLSSEEYYRRLLGVPKAQTATTGVHRKTHGHSLTQATRDALGIPYDHPNSISAMKAYQAALMHYQLELDQERQAQRDKDKNKNDKNKQPSPEQVEQATMQQVDDMLEQAAQEEYHQAAHVLMQARALRRRPRSDDSTDDAPSIAIGPRTTMADLVQQYQGQTHQSWRRLMRGGRKVNAQEPQTAAGDPVDWGTLSDRTNRLWQRVVEQDSQLSSKSQAPKDYLGSVPPDPTGERERQVVLEEAMRRAGGPQAVFADTKKDTPPTTPSGTTTALDHVFTNVLHAEPRVLEGMMRWSQRLQAVPYLQWTVGAAVALDHWIARHVLGLSEPTWQAVLHGTTDDPSLASRGEQILQARQALFPETSTEHESVVEQEDGDEEEHQDEAIAKRTELEAQKLQEQNQQDQEQEDPKNGPPESPGMEGSPNPAVEDLLSSLGDLARPNHTNKNSQTTTTTTATTPTATMRPHTLPEVNAQVDEIMDELQDWRRLHQSEQPYDEWDAAQQNKLNDWITSKFVPLCGTGNHQAHEVDLPATREALLNAPPISRQESQAFWSNLQDEQDAVDLLERMRRDGPPPTARNLLQTSFWELSHKDQLDQLLNLGAIRPLLEEYTKESDRRAFLQKYGDILLTGVPLEHLVPDPEGSIGLEELQQVVQDQYTQGGMEGGLDAEWMKELNKFLTSTTTTKSGTLDSSRSSSLPTRFRIERIPYRGTLGDVDDDGSDDSSSSTDPYAELLMSRALFKAWNTHKANRAQYEETLFREHQLGLDYDHPPQVQTEDDLADLEEDDSNKKKKKKKRTRRSHGSVLNQYEVEKVREYEARMSKRFPLPPGAPSHWYK